MTKSPQPTLCTLALLAPLLLFGASHLHSQAPSQPTAPAPADAAKAAKPGGAPRPQRTPAEPGWWNRKAGEDLVITPAQKKLLDERADRLAETQRAIQEKMRETRDALQIAYKASNWAEARRLFDRQAAHSAELIKAQGEAQIAVLEALTAAQRTQLVANYPTLLTAPVIRARLGRPDPADEGD